MSYVGTVLTLCCCTLSVLFYMSLCIQDEEAASKANEALQPVRDWLQRQQPTEHSAFTRQEQQEAPTGYFTGETTTTHDSGPGHDVSASQHTTQAGSWTTGETGSEAAQTYERQATERAKGAQEAQMGHSAVKTTTEAGNWTTGKTGSKAAQTYENEATNRARSTREAQMEQGALQNASDLQVWSYVLLLLVPIRPELGTWYLHPGCWWDISPYVYIHASILEAKL